MWDRRPTLARASRRRRAGPTTRTSGRRSSADCSASARPWLTLGLLFCMVRFSVVLTFEDHSNAQSAFRWRAHRIRSASPTRNSAGHTNPCAYRASSARGSRTLHAWNVRASDRGRASRAGAPDQELCRLVAGQLWPDFRRAFSHDLYAEVSPDHGRQHEHRLAGATHLSSEPGRSAARRALGIRSARSLHHSLSLSDGGRICRILAEAAAAGQSEIRARAGSG